MTAPRTPDETAMRLADLLGDHGLHLGDRSAARRRRSGFGRGSLRPAKAFPQHTAAGRQAAMWRVSCLRRRDLRYLRRGRPTGADGMIEFDCEGCGGHVVATGRDTIPRSGLECATCEWLCEFVPDPEAMMEVRKHLDNPPEPTA